jgi:Uma2 family endonuclease
MSAVTLQPPRKRFTRAEIEQMLEAGVFAGQRLELIDGDLIDKMGQKPPHAHAIQVLFALLANMFGGKRIRGQLPIEVSTVDQERSLPEPDLAVLREYKAEYRRRHPRGGELLLVVEVADATVQYDATIKRDLYARAQVPEYWVLDVTGRRLIVHRNPAQGKFGQVVILSESDAVCIESEPGASIPVAEMLP